MPKTNNFLNYVQHVNMALDNARELISVLKSTDEQVAVGYICMAIKLAHNYLIDHLIETKFFDKDAEQLKFPDF